MRYDGIEMSIAGAGRSVEEAIVEMGHGNKEALMQVAESIDQLTAAGKQLRENPNDGLLRYEGPQSRAPECSEHPAREQFQISRA